MILTKATVGPFRSINTVQTVEIDPSVTVLVGMNEAGKTVFLKALHKASDALGQEKFNVTDDYPRKDLTAYTKRHASNPDTAVVLTYAPTSGEISAVNTALGTALPDDFTFSLIYQFDNVRTIGIEVDQRPPLVELSKSAGLSTEVSGILAGATTLKTAIEKIRAVDKNEADNTFLATLEKRAEGVAWSNIIANEVWVRLSSQVPKFLYFSDYDLLPGKLNLADLASRVAAAKADTANANKQVQPKHQAVLALLRMADVDVADFSGTTSYEELKAKVEAVSISLTDRVLEFWKQNEDL